VEFGKKRAVTGNASTVTDTQNKGECIPVYASKGYEGVEVQLPLFLTFAPD
jgi:hypothetical protein